MFKVEENFILDESGYVVAEVWNSGNNEQNKSLLAAAPEMLGALKDIAVRFEIELSPPLRGDRCGCNQFVDSGKSCRHTAVIDAIAKAEGKS